MRLSEDQKWHAAWIIATLVSVVVGAIIGWKDLAMVPAFIMVGSATILSLLLVWFVEVHHHIAGKILFSAVLLVAAGLFSRWLYRYDRPVLNPEIGQITQLDHDRAGELVLGVEALVKNPGRQSGYSDSASLILRVDGSPTEGKQIYAQQLPSKVANEPELYSQEFPPGKPVRGWLFFSFPGMTQASIASHFACDSELLNSVSLRLVIRDSAYKREWIDDKRLKELGRPSCIEKVTPPPKPVPPPVARNPRPPSLQNQVATVPAAPPPPLQVSAPDGVAIGRDNYGNPTVNNYAPPDRHITASQRDAILAVFDSLPAGVYVQVYTANASEPSTFGQEISNLIPKSHAQDRIIDLEPSPKGLYLIVHDEKDDSAPYATRLASAMGGSGITVTGVLARPYMHPGVIRIFVCEQ
jgi:hypothetical protein